MEKSLAERISETPRMKLIVSDVKALPQSMVLSSKLMLDHVKPVEYAGLPGQCFVCRQMGPENALEVRRPCIVEMGSMDGKAQQV